MKELSNYTINCLVKYRFLKQWGRKLVSLTLKKKSTYLIATNYLLYEIFNFLPKVYTDCLSLNINNHNQMMDILEDYISFYLFHTF